MFVSGTTYQVLELGQPIENGKKFDHIVLLQCLLLQLPDTTHLLLLSLASLLLLLCVVLQFEIRLCRGGPCGPCGHNITTAAQEKAGACCVVSVLEPSDSMSSSVCPTWLVSPNSISSVNLMLTWLFV